MNLYSLKYRSQFKQVHLGINLKEKISAQQTHQILRFNGGGDDGEETCQTVII